MRKIFHGLDTFLKSALIVLTTFMIGTVTWQVISRYGLRAPSSLTEEIARFQLIWLGLLGAVYTFRNRMHVGIDILVSPLRGKKRLAAELFALSAALTFALVLLVYGGSQLVILTYELNQTSAALGVRMAYVYSILPISGLLMSAYALLYIYDIIRHGKMHVPTETVDPIKGDTDLSDY